MNLTKCRDKIHRLWVFGVKTKIVAEDDNNKKENFFPSNSENFFVKFSRELISIRMGHQEKKLSIKFIIKVLNPLEPARDKF